MVVVAVENRNKMIKVFYFIFVVVPLALSDLPHPHHDPAISKFVQVCARLVILFSVSGCSGPSSLILASSTSTSNCSASPKRPWFQNTEARSLILISVGGCFDGLSAKC